MWASWEWPSTEIERYPNAHDFTYAAQDIIFAGRFLTVTGDITYCKISRVITNPSVSSLYLCCFPYEPCILVRINGEDHYECFITNMLPLCSIFAFGRAATTLPAMARLTSHLQSRGGVVMGLSTPKWTPSGRPSLTLFCSNTEIASDIGTANNGMRLKSFRPWNTIGMKMLPFKDRREMLRPSQVSEPITTIQSH